MGKSKIMGFGITTQDIMDLLREKYDFPEDTIITRLERSLNQDAWVINLYSPEFKEHGDLDILSTERLRPGYKYVKEAI